MLKEKFRERGPECGLRGLLWHEFVLESHSATGRQGSKSKHLYLEELSASDCYQVCSALLEHVPPNLGSEEFAEKVGDEERCRMEQDHRNQNFWKAYDAVLCRDPDIVAEGIQRATAAQEEIVHEAQHQKEVKGRRAAGGGDFTYYVLRRPPSANFRNPKT